VATTSAATWSSPIVDLDQARAGARHAAAGHLASARGRAPRAGTSAVAAAPGHTRRAHGAAEPHFPQRRAAAPHRRSARRGDSLSILYIDCDNFKNINDSRGHSIGDDYLRSVARRLRDSIASPDLVVRMGGDEFLVVTRHYGLEPTAPRSPSAWPRA
jgi:hypothetical protein